MRAHFSARRSSCRYVKNKRSWKKEVALRVVHRQQCVTVQWPWRAGWCRWVARRNQRRWWGRRHAEDEEWEDRGGCRSGHCPPRGSFYSSHPEAHRCKRTHQGLKDSRAKWMRGIICNFLHLKEHFILHELAHSVCPYTESPASHCRIRDGYNLKATPLVTT